VQYFQTLLDTNLLSPQGFICVDNTLLQGQAYLPEQERTPNGEAIAQFNRVIKEDPRVEQVLLPVRDGLTIIRRVTKV
jgi:caffeoyl-CoA O-methyltransferase